MLGGESSEPESGGSSGSKFCKDHESESLKGFCKDCFNGICFRCAIGKHRNHNIIMLDEIEKGDLLDQINLFESKVIKFSEKAKSLLERVKNFETHSDQLEDIFEKFGKITSQFENGHYKKMIVGKLETNYDQINEMSAKLDHENTQNGEIKERIKQFENGETGKNMKAFDEIRNAIDDR